MAVKKPFTRLLLPTFIITNFIKFTISLTRVLTVNIFTAGLKPLTAILCTLIIVDIRFVCGGLFYKRCVALSMCVRGIWWLGLYEPHWNRTTRFCVVSIIRLSRVFSRTLNIQGIYCSKIVLRSLKTLNIQPIKSFLIISNIIIYQYLINIHITCQNYNDRDF